MDQPSMDRQEQRRLRTLLVDDTPAMLRLLSGFLEAQESIEVVGTATDGREALERVESLQPDLVLLDMQMPEMNGLEAAEHLRRRFPAIRVVMVTVHDTPEAREASARSGAHGFVPKGRVYQELLGEIGRVCAAQEGGSPLQASTILFRIA